MYIKAEYSFSITRQNIGQKCIGFKLVRIIIFFLKVQNNMSHQIRYSDVFYFIFVCFDVF